MQYNNSANLGKFSISHKLFLLSSSLAKRKVLSTNDFSWKKFNRLFHPQNPGSLAHFFQIFPMEMKKVPSEEGTFKYIFKSFLDVKVTSINRLKAFYRGYLMQARPNNAILQKILDER